MAAQRSARREVSPGPGEVAQGFGEPARARHNRTLCKLANDITQSGMTGDCRGEARMWTGRASARGYYLIVRRTTTRQASDDDRFRDVPHHAGDRRLQIRCVDLPHENFPTRSELASRCSWCPLLIRSSFLLCVEGRLYRDRPIAQSPDYNESGSSPALLQKWDSCDEAMADTRPAIRPRRVTIGTRNTCSLRAKTKNPSNAAKLPAYDP